MSTATAPRERTRKLPDFITLDPVTGAATIALQFGLTVSGVPVKAIKMRRPKVKDRLAASAMANGDAAKEEMTLFANLAELAPEELEELDLLDYARLGTTFKSFLSSETPPNSAAQS